MQRHEMGKRKNGAAQSVDVISPSTPGKTTKDSSEVKDPEASGRFARVTRSRTKSGRIAAAHVQAKTPSPEFSTAEINLNDSKTEGELEAMVRSPSMNPSVDSTAVETPAHSPSPVQIRSGKKAVVPKIEDKNYDVPSVPILQNVPTSYPPSAHETVLPECEAAFKIDMIASLQPTKEEVQGAQEVIREHSDSALPSVSNLGADSQAVHVFPLEPPHPEVKSGGGVDSLATAIASFDDDPSFWDQVVAMEERRESGAQAEHSGPTRPGHPTIGSENAPTFNVSDADLQRKVWVNRGPVLSLWAAVVAQREGHRWQSAVTIGRAIASNFATSKAQKLGIQRSSVVDGEWEELPVFGTFVSAKKTKEGVCAVQNGRVISAQAAQSYLQNAFSVNLPSAQAAMERLASCYHPRDIGSVAYKLYEDFRPGIPDGVQGWGAKGLLDLSKISLLVAFVKTNVS